MATILRRIPFDKDLLPLVQDFDCAAEYPPKFWEDEINEWIRLDPTAEDGALFYSAKGTNVWLYANEDAAIVGYGAICQSNWPDPAVIQQLPKLKRVPISLIPAVGIDKRFQGGLEGAEAADRYSTKIMNHLVFWASKHTERQNFLGLYVHPANEKAIKLYRRMQFRPFKQKYWHEKAGVDYVSMILRLTDYPFQPEA
jgi:GNAT superfamily N-acetyltransferase